MKCSSASGVTAGTLNHDCKIDWLELNPHATHLLFRDKKQQLHLFNLLTQVYRSSEYTLEWFLMLTTVVIFSLLYIYRFSIIIFKFGILQLQDFRLS